MENIVLDKSNAFALRTVKLFRYLCEEKKEFILSKQLLRAGTSIGANITEAQCAISRKEFLAKMYIAFKECAETLYWMELLFLGGYISEKEYLSLKPDCEELYGLLSSITKTTARS